MSANHTNGFFPLRAAAAGPLRRPRALRPGPPSGVPTCARRRPPALVSPLGALLTALLLAAGCTGVRNGQAALAAVRDGQMGLSNRVEQLRQTIATVGGRVDASVANFDVWTLRLLMAGVVLLVLSYPAGKLVWLFAGRLGRARAGETNGC